MLGPTFEFEELHPDVYTDNDMAKIIPPSNIATLRQHFFHVGVLALGQSRIR